MAGLDPLTSVILNSVEGPPSASEALDLGIAAEVLQAQLHIGDLLDAIVLPPQNGHDLIEILGQQVVAQLPPNVRPGEHLVLQVTGFSGNQLFVRNLGQPDPGHPEVSKGAATVNVVLTPSPNASNSSTAAAVSANAPNNSVNTNGPNDAVIVSSSNNSVGTNALNDSSHREVSKDPEPVEGRAPVAPPRAVFVAASVRQAAQPPAAAPQQTPTPAQTATPPQTIISRAIGNLDARIAAAQSVAPQVPSKATNPTSPIAQQTPKPATLPAAVRAQVQNAVQQIAQQAVRTVSDLLRAVRLPDTPFTRTAAAIAPQAPVRIPSVLQRLEAALPKDSPDPRVATLRTLIAFTARINAANEETLPVQIASYVSNVVEGTEPKLQQMLSSLAHEPPTHGVQHAIAAQSHAAERAAAIDHDLKSVVLSLLRDPGATRSPALTQALNETLLTLTGTQLNAISSQTQTPGTLTITLPLLYHEGGKPAQIRISRDGQSSSQKLDADNFHVAFILDTAHLGTVAIDLQTSGRTVKLDVKTERQTAASRFEKTLDSLRTRLENLRYRVSSATAAALTVPRDDRHRDGSIPHHRASLNAGHREVSNDPEVSKGNVDLKA